MRSLFLIDAGVMPPASGKGKEDARFEKRGDTGTGTPFGERHDRAAGGSAARLTGGGNRPSRSLCRM